MRNLLLTLVISLCWAIWPILAQRYGKGHYLFTWICLGTFVAVGIIQYFQHKGVSTIEGVSILQVVGIPIALGLLNGIAMSLYPTLLGSTDNPGNWVAIVTALISVFSVAIGAVLIDSISWKELLGIVFVVIGIMLMQKP